MARVHANGIDLYYEETGSGMPLVLLPGFATHSSIWHPQLPALTPHFRVITLDPRGAGQSSVPPGPYTTRQMADDTAALLDALGVATAHVVGWSMGGMVAQELALA